MKRLLCLVALAGCEPISQVGAQSDASAGDRDAAIANTCDGTADAFVFSGAVAFQAYDFGMVTSNGQIVGLAGSALNTDVMTFNSRGLTELQTIGAHDIAVQNLTALRAPFNQSCDTGNTVCHGFFARAGTYTVLAVHPRYQVTFTLSDLTARTDNAGPPGAAIAGSIAGCIDKANP
jgi:hypothetical protein